LCLWEFNINPRVTLAWKTPFLHHFVLEVPMNWYPSESSAISRRARIWVSKAPAELSCVCTVLPLGLPWCVLPCIMLFFEGIPTLLGTKFQTVCGPLFLRGECHQGIYNLDTITWIIYYITWIQIPSTFVLLKLLWCILYLVALTCKGWYQIFFYEDWKFCDMQHVY
jgi:hypothetical protein